MSILILQGILSHSNIFVRINRTSSNMSISVTAKNQPSYLSGHCHCHVFCNMGGKMLWWQKPCQPFWDGNVANIRDVISHISLFIFNIKRR